MDSWPGNFWLNRVLEVGWREPCVFGDPREHLRPYLGAVVKSEDKIRPAVTL